MRIFNQNTIDTIDYSKISDGEPFLFKIAVADGSDSVDFIVGNYLEDSLTSKKTFILQNESDSCGDYIDLEVPECKKHIISILPLKFMV